MKFGVGHQSCHITKQENYCRLPRRMSQSVVFFGLCAHFTPGRQKEIPQKHWMGANMMKRVLELCALVAVALIKLISNLQNHWRDAKVMTEALALCANLAYAQPNHPMGFRGWSHLKNQVGCFFFPLFLQCSQKANEISFAPPKCRHARGDTRA